MKQPRGRGPGEGAGEVDPEQVQGTREQRRSQGARRVQGGARQRPAHQDAEDEREADDDRRQVPRSAAGGDSENGVDQNEGQNRFEDQSLPRGNTLVQDGGAERGFRTEQEVEQRRPGDAAGHLRHPVGDRLPGLHFARDEPPEADRRVEVAAAQGAVPVGVGDHHEAVRKGRPDQSADPDGDGSGADEDEEKGAEDFGCERLEIHDPYCCDMKAVPAGASGLARRWR